jgi:predicted membrane metal-binding protein
MSWKNPFFISINCNYVTVPSLVANSKILQPYLFFSPLAITYVIAFFYYTNIYNKIIDYLIPQKISFMSNTLDGNIWAIVLICSA